MTHHQNTNHGDLLDSPRVPHLLPSNLLDSSFFDSPPVNQNSNLHWDSMPRGYSYVSPIVQDEGEGDDRRGLKLTTQSGLAVDITDPYVAEQLLLAPLRATLIAAYRRWVRADDQTGDTTCTELAKSAQMLSNAYNEYLLVFGCIPGSGCNLNPGTSYLDYVMVEIEGWYGLTELEEAILYAQNGITKIAKDTWSNPNNDGASEIDHKIKIPVMKDEIWMSLSRDETSTRRMKVHRAKPQERMTESAYNIRYKTQLCRHFDKLNGYCPTGSSCHFAHGFDELRSPELHPKFRTKVCRNFFDTGMCQFGESCFFQHEIHSSSTGSVQLGSSHLDARENDWPTQPPPPPPTPLGEEDLLIENVTLRKEISSRILRDLTYKIDFNCQK